MERPFCIVREKQVNCFTCVRILKGVSDAGGERAGVASTYDRRELVTRDQVLPLQFFPPLLRTYIV